MAKRIMIAGKMGGPVLGYGGNTWAFLQYLLGFRRLGFETYYVEHRSASECVDEAGRPAAFSASANARYVSWLMERFALGEHLAFLEWEGEGHVGLSPAEVEKLAPEVDLLINLSGHLHLPSVLSKVRRRLYLDLDPGYTQIWQEGYGIDMNLRGHDVYVTVGLNLGHSDCPLPQCGIDWERTLPPVVLSEWRTAVPPGVAYSTVADWYGFRQVEWGGVWYGQKGEEFLRIIELPQRVSVPLELCLFIHADEPARVTLEEHGWRLVSPQYHAATPDTYRHYIWEARGELTCVKHGYAAGRTGWFSDRSACYLAAGRPVIVQDTGLERYVPTGAGLLTFTDLDSVTEALERVEHDYAQHAAAATEFARAYLDSDRVLPHLLQLASV
jgi:hypothetical protein